ncbi:phosphonate ABC transporter, permease protein PhnE [Salinicola sp. RZ23]|uniref:phosphonate ABC transporter, permease protein PhnE n=1 Tax=Salinicola sp. RZ23 TaxID=1949087 RepID=UPI0018E53C30|nr:phosphonate ABC transporter, permease protein PhnE [Salinicola sp. RZ23]
MTSLIKAPTPAEVARIERQNPELFRAQGRYLRRLGLSGLAVVVFYGLFLLQYGISPQQALIGLGKMGHYFLHMFIWRDFWHWPFDYYLTQIFITVAIVFTGTLTATLIALPCSFLAARNVMSSVWLRPIGFLMRRLFDILRGVDMAIWGLIFVSAVGLGPLAGALAILVQDTGLLGKLYAEGHEAVAKEPTRGLNAVGANSLQKYRLGVFTQSFPTFLSLSLYQLESNTRSAAVLGFVGAGGVGLIYAENMRLWHWDVVMFITLCLVVIVMLIDALSAQLRKRYILGKEIPDFEPATPRHPEPPYSASTQGSTSPR